MVDSRKIECVAILANKDHRQLFLNSKSDNCPGDGYWCFDLASGVTYNPYMPIRVDAGDVSSNYSIMVGRRMQGSIGDPDSLVIVVFKNGQRDPFNIFEPNLGSGINVDSVVFAFDSPNLVSVYSPKSATLNILQIGEVEIAFPVGGKSDVNGKIVFENLENTTDYQRLEARSIFKDPVVVQPPPTKSFLARFWWIIVAGLLTAVLVAGVAAFLIRRENLRKEIVKKDDSSIARLEEFYYR